MITGIRVGGLAHTGEKPLTVLFDEHIAVAGATRRATIRRENRRGSILNSQIGRRKPHRGDIDPQLQAFVFREEFRERILDRFSAFDQTAVFVHVIAVRRPKRCDRFGVALVESFDERLCRVGDGCDLLLIGIGRANL